MIEVVDNWRVLWRFRFRMDMVVLVRQPNKALVDFNYPVLFLEVPKSSSSCCSS